MVEMQNTFELPKPGYDALTALHPVESAHIEVGSEETTIDEYEKYLRIHKVLVGTAGAKQLEAIHERLKDESMPRFLVAAGSAAVEAALVQHEEPTDYRLELFESGIDTWRRAIINQRIVNGLGNKSMIEHALPYRVALDIATSGLVREVIKGRVTMPTTRSVFEDCLAIAQSNIMQLKLAETENNVDALGEHTGLGYECNALLLFNRRHARKRFMVPSLARADSGYFYRRQTHDLMIINQEWGVVRNVIPVEIKSSTSRRDHQRYGALLVRGKMHLSDSGQCRPAATLEAITKDYEHRAGEPYDNTANNISNTLHTMVRDYCAGKSLTDLVHRSVTSFHDPEVVAARHPGFQLASS